MAVAREYPTPPAAIRRLPRIFMPGRLSRTMGLSWPSWHDWRDRYGGGPGSFWRWLAWPHAIFSDKGYARAHAVSEWIQDLDYHRAYERNETCHRHDGRDYHYCAPGARCPEWIRQERAQLVPRKALTGWGNYLFGER